MAAMEDLLSQALLASAPLADLVDRRIHWDKLVDREQVPAITLHLMAGRPRLYTMKRRVPLTTYVVLIKCWGGTNESASQVKLRVIAVLDTLNTKPLQAFIEGDGAGWAPAPGPGADDTSDLFDARTNVRLWHHETA